MIFRGAERHSANLGGVSESTPRRSMMQYAHCNNRVSYLCKHAFYTDRARKPRVGGVGRSRFRYVLDHVNGAVGSIRVTIVLGVV